MLLNPDHFAYPCPGDGEGDRAEGLTIREKFALAVYAGLYSCCPPYDPDSDEQAARRKRWALEATLAADELVAALNRPRQQ